MLGAGLSQPGKGDAAVGGETPGRELAECAWFLRTRRFRQRTGTIGATDGKSDRTEWPEGTVGGVEA
jgi:hypothetical protein